MGFERCEKHPWGICASYFIKNGQDFYTKELYHLAIQFGVQLRLGRQRCISGAIIGDGDRKSWDPRGPMIWDNISIFRTNCAILTSWIHARVVGSRVDVVTLHDQLVRVAIYSCRFFTAMAGNKAEKKNQGSSVYFNALM